LANWVHSKTLIWTIVQACKNYVHPLSIECNQNIYLNVFPRLQALPASIGQLSALKNLDLNNCSSLQKLPTSIAQLNALYWFAWLFELARITYVYWSI
jgi:hypothetical protein